MIFLILPIYVADQENEHIQHECFESFNQNTDRSTLKVILIDNGSQYGVDEAREFADIYVRTESPLGYAKAVNIGWKMTECFDDCEYVGVLNNDLTFKENWLSPLLENLDDNTSACASYDFPCEGVTDHIWSSCFLMKNDTRQRIGYFDDKELPFRYHDQDYWIRAINLGLTFKRIGASQVGHKESTTYKKMVQKNNESVEENLMKLRWGTHMAQYYKK